jgi:hypothetical protein
MALPLGEANQLKKDKVNLELSRNTAQRATEAFKELDSATAR